VVIDVISDTSSNFTSNDFFQNRTIIQKAMKKDLQERVRASTWHEVIFFQLRSLSLPDGFEQEIQNTEVKGQDILKATSEKKRDQVRFDTNVLVAQLAVKATMENAYGSANKTIFEARAVESTVKEVVTK
jgi:hypothetical protein